MPRPRTDIRARVLDAARERFAAQGVDGSSLRAIAKDAGTSIGMIYYYFPTKEALFLEVVEGVYSALLADLESALDEQADFASSVRELYARIAAISPLERQVMALVAREALASGDRLRTLAQRMSRGHVPLILRTIGRGLARGELRNDLHPIALMAATVALGTLPQVALRAVAKYLPIAPPDAEVLSEQLARALLEGVGRRELEVTSAAPAELARVTSPEGARSRKRGKPKPRGAER